MKSTRSLKKGRDDLQAGGFKAGVDLTDHVLRDGVGFDDRQGTLGTHAFDGHVFLS
jgi:hypothetical protein